MKKILLGLTIALSYLSINTVKAESIELPYSNTLEHNCGFYVTDYDYLVELGYSDIVEELYRLLIEEYKTNYSETYPYYYLDLVARDNQNCNQISSFNSVGYISAFLNLYSEIPTSTSWQIPNADLILHSSYNVSSSVYNTPTTTTGYAYPSLIYNSSSAKYYNPMAYFISNFDYYYNGSNSYNIVGNSNFTINSGDIIKPIFMADNAFQTGYIEINLNDYVYVALALKDYNRDAFSTNVQVKGQYCLTPVYNYGMTERKEILEGTQVERCSPYYDNYTTVRTSILNSDLQNHAIYYLKSYDTSKDNYVKIDTTVFDVTLITEEEKDNPYVMVNGKTYPTIPYDELTDTATKSEDEGYVSGESEKFDFSNIFTAPLDFLKEIWSTITTFFILITSFISLLPPILQNFLYASFMLAIALGLIKIIL